MSFLRPDFFYSKVYWNKLILHYGILRILVRTSLLIIATVMCLVLSGRQLSKGLQKTSLLKHNQKIFTCVPYLRRRYEYFFICVDFVVYA